jgi:hypothetical protein
MVKHIVFFKLKAQAEGASKEENARKVKRQIESLRGKIPGMIHIEVGLDFERSDAAWDLAILGEFIDRQALAEYQNHPEHLAVADFIKNVRESRALVDYEASPAEAHLHRLRGVASRVRSMLRR